jgi:preprotein translocase subunit YajC
MSDSNMGLWILAQQGGTVVEPVGVPGVAQSPATTSTPGASQGPYGQQAGGMGLIMWLLPAMLLLMVLMSWLGSRKEKKRQQALLGSLRKGDKVQMLGGIIGTIAEVGDVDVVVRVEEGRIRFAKNAVQSVIQSTRAPGAVEPKPEAAVSV